ncbi:hypothetical protein B0O99DRAFT_559095, partial [Bisporella sp. PMI_857]
MLFSYLYFFVCTLSAFLLESQKTLFIGRLDPIVSPNGLSGHVHNVLGGSAFAANATDLTTGKCTTMEIPDDQSAYWISQLYGQWPNGTFSPLKPVYNRIYYIMQDPAVKTYPFPPGLKVLLGSPSSTGPPAVPYTLEYLCDQGGAGGSQVPQDKLPNFVCHRHLQFQAKLPYCWDGKNLDSTDHISHLSYTTPCTGNFPIQLPQLSIEFAFDSTPFSPDKIFTSFGGSVNTYGAHVDFFSGWKGDTLERAINDPTCLGRQNIFGDGEQCKTLLALRDTATASQCIMSNYIPQEDIGLHGPIATLPGCNPLWTVEGSTKPGCTVAPPVPGLGPASDFVDYWQQSHNIGPDSGHNLVPAYAGFNPAPTSAPAPTSTKTTTQPTALSTVTAPVATSVVWKSLGCYTDDVNSRALEKAGSVRGGMTVAACQAACGKLGFAFAGVEYSTECWCGSSIGGSQNKATDSGCDMICSGSTEYCGGGNRINIYQLVPASSVRWKSLGCYTDAASARALAISASVSGGLTPSACQVACGKLGFAF